MKAIPAAWPASAPCIITALELLGVDDPAMPEGRARRAFAALEPHLGDFLICAGRRVLHVLPIGRGGATPFRALLSLVRLLADLVRCGVVVRGGITLGDARVRCGLAFGAGVTVAERLRDEVADVARVIVDPGLLRQVELRVEFRGAGHTAMEELGYLHDLLRQDADGFWFIDYLAALESEVASPPLYFDFLKEHRQLLMRTLDAAGAAGLSRGLAWLWAYHGRIVEAHKAAHPDDPHLAEVRLPAAPFAYRFPRSAVLASSTITDELEPERSPT